MEWWTWRGQNPSGPVEGNVVTLSRPFYDEISQHRIPVGREVLAVLANASGVLDFYVWLAWKSFTLGGHTARIPLLEPCGLAAQLGSAPYAVERTFRLTVHRWLRTVSALWPQCPANLAAEENYLTVEPSYQTCAVWPTHGGRTCQRTE